jgi:hypothetical protein
MITQHEEGSEKEPAYGDPTPRLNLVESLKSHEKLHRFE